MSSFLTYRTPVLRSALSHASRSQTQRAAFSFSARQLSLNEDRTNDPSRKQDVEDHKHDSLNKQKDGKGHWKEDLASNSEQAVKADRGEVDASADTIKKLQKEAEKVGKQ